MTRSGIVGLGLAFALASLAGTAAAANPPRIDEPAARWDGTRVHVSYRVSGALTDERLERIHSGIPLRFQHRVELRAPRGPLLPARELGRTVVETHVEYESLTQQYRLRREFRLHEASGAVAAEPLVDEMVTDSREAMEDWMTRLGDVPLEPSSSRPWSAARVRIEVTLDRRWVLFVIPSTVHASGTVEIERPH